MKAIIHIGATKTGTSALQHFLNKNNRSLEKLGYWYPAKSLISDAHHLLAAYFHQNAKNLHHVDVKNDWEGFIGQFRSELSLGVKARRGQTLLLSSEYFWSAGELKKTEFVQFLKELGVTEIEIVGYLREFSDWLQSEYNQGIKAGNSIKFDAWVGKKIANYTGFHNYKFNLRGWENAGVDSIIMRPYCKDFIGWGICCDFMSFLDVEMSSLKFAEGSLVNTSPNVAEIELLSILNGMDTSDTSKSKLRKAISFASQDREMFQGFGHFSAENFERLSERYNKRLKWVVKRYMAPEHQAFQVVKPKPITRTLEQANDEKIAVLLRVLSSTLK